MILRKEANMPEMHIAAQLISAPVVAAGSAPEGALIPPPAGTASALAGGSDAFAALLAGKIALVAALAVPERKAVGASDAAMPAVAAGTGKTDPVPEDHAPMKDPLVGQADAYPASPAPGITAQLLAAMGAFAPPATPANTPANTLPEPQVDGTATAGAISAAGQGVTAIGKPSAPTPEAETRAPKMKSATQPAVAMRETKSATQPAVAMPEDVASKALETPRESVPSATHGPANARASATPSLLPLHESAPAAPAGSQPETTPAPAQVPQSEFHPGPPVTPVSRWSVPGLMGTHQWREDFATGVSLLATQRVSAAELRVQPAELGPVHVSIRIEAGEANITCTAQHAETRNAMEAALPRLREILEASGISVGSTNVGPQSSGHGSGDPARQAPARSRGFTQDAEVPVPIAAARVFARADQLVDVFA